MHKYICHFSIFPVYLMPYLMHLFFSPPSFPLSPYFSFLLSLSFPPSLSPSPPPLSPPFSSGLVSNNVPITIQRHGLVGNVQVTWSTGLLIDGVANGSLTPSTGSYFMAAETPQLTINFTVRN